MPQDLNRAEIELLHENPEELLLQYQFMIEATVAGFVRKGFFKQEEKADIVQQINLQCLETKLKKIKAQFNGSVYLRTYFSKIVFNSCQEIARQGKKKQQTTTLELLEYKAVDFSSAHEKMVIQDELYRLKAILIGLGKKKSKASLSFKVLIRIILKLVDIQFYTSPKTQVEIDLIKNHFFQAYENLSDKEAFAILVQLFNKLEGKSNDADSLRKWVHQLLDRTITLLNSETSPSNYDKESLKILLQYYFTSPDRI